jgi:hypothetical protein
MGPLRSLMAVLFAMVVLQAPAVAAVVLAFDTTVPPNGIPRLESARMN